MKKTYIGILAIALMLLASCGTSEVTPQTSQTTEQTVKIDSTKPKDQRLAAMDSIYAQTETSLEKFISEHGDPTYDDVWWDSKKGEDLPFKRIRLCPIPGSALIIERRPFPFTKKLEALCYSIGKGEDGKYVVQASRFEKNTQVESHKAVITTPDEMLQAVAIFNTRLQEASENVAAIEVNCHQKDAIIKKFSKNG